MRIFALESSAGPASAAIAEDGKLLAEFYINTRLTHSQTLMVLAENAMKLTGSSPGGIDAFAVANGPGSFTGVRIGVSCLKGLAFGRDVPCVGVSTLRAMAENLRGADCVACAVMDARVGQVYNALFSIKGGVVTRLTEDRALPVDALREECARFGSELVLVGDGAALCHETFKAFGARLAPENIRYQRASGVASAAWEMIAAGETVTAEALRPAYLRLPQAERELRAKGGASGAATR